MPINLNAVYVLASAIAILILTVQDLRPDRDHGKRLRADLAVIMALWSVPLAIAMEAEWQILRYVFTVPFVACSAAFLIITLKDVLWRRRKSSENTR